MTPPKQLLIPTLALSMGLVIAIVIAQSNNPSSPLHPLHAEFNRILALPPATEEGEPGLYVRSEQGDHSIYIFYEDGRFMLFRSLGEERWKTDNDGSLSAAYIKADGTTRDYKPIGTLRDGMLVLDHQDYSTTYKKRAETNPPN